MANPVKSSPEAASTTADQNTDGAGYLSNRCNAARTALTINVEHRPIAARSTGKKGFSCGPYRVTRPCTNVVNLRDFCRNGEERYERQGGRGEGGYVTWANLAKKVPATPTDAPTSSVGNTMEGTTP